METLQFLIATKIVASTLHFLLNFKQQAAFQFIASTHAVHDDHRLWEVGIDFSVWDVFLGASDVTTTFKLHQWRSDLQQLEPLHFSHTPAQHLADDARERKGKQRRRKKSIGKKKAKREEERERKRERE